MDNHWPRERIMRELELFASNEPSVLDNMLFLRANYRSLLMTLQQERLRSSALDLENTQLAVDVQMLYQWSTEAAQLLTRVSNLNKNGQQLLDSAKKMMLLVGEVN